MSELCYLRKPRLDIKELYLKLKDFIGQVRLQWYSYNEIDNIDILVLRRVCEKL